ncbi:MAG: hypothetical protein JXR70_14070 [Spirochaetales bacterium]|nr:hypothetical protein [Spirochaetales bacterium]
MGEFLDQVPEKIQDHIRALAKAAGLGENEEAYEKLASGWIEKKELFESETQRQGMEEIDMLEASDPRGAIAMTYSGSLINLGPLIDESRHAVYTSIGLRTDAPDRAEKEGSTLKSDMKVDEPLHFGQGPVKSTSMIYKIAVFTESDEMSAEEEESNITAVMTQLEDLMLGVNKTILSE